MQPGDYLKIDIFLILVIGCFLTGYVYKMRIFDSQSRVKSYNNLSETGFVLSYKT